MLSELSIENFAIIDRLFLRLESGFTVLTGETGAGKSIIIDALHAALGARIPAEVVRVGARHAWVEAVFELPSGTDATLEALLQDCGVEMEDTLILRRDVSAAGRTTARLNGRAVPLATLAAVGSLLGDIHGQTDHLSILRRDNQLDVLDRFGELLALRAEVTAAVKRYTRLRELHVELEGGRREAEQRLDLLRFQVQEIESAGLRGDEEDELEGERNLLSNAERLTQLSTYVFESLRGDGGGLEPVDRAAASASELASIDANLTALSQRLEAAQYELEDIAQDVRQYRDAVDYDPERLDEIEARLNTLARLKRKYGATVQDVIEFGKQTRFSMEEVENLDERLVQVATELGEAEAEAASLAAQLSAARYDAARGLETAMGAALQGLGLKGTDFQVETARTSDADGLLLPDSVRYHYGLTGVDTVTFLVSFNPGEQLRPLERVASGGETSRFLLALKSVLAQADRTPTLIFDEVDVGVGGRRAIVVGERMRDLSRGHQVISITHMPQIAALADHHLAVVKSFSGDRTTVGVRELEQPDRVLEIAQMMSGTETEAAQRNAQELLEAARRSS